MPSTRALSYGRFCRLVYDEVGVRSVLGRVVSFLAADFRGWGGVDNRTRIWGSILWIYADFFGKNL